MIDSSDNQADKVRLLAGMLEKLRTHDGLTLERLSSDRTGLTAPLIDLAVTRRYADSHNLDPAVAAFKLVLSCVRDDLDGTQQIIADAILGLRLHLKAYDDAGLDGNITRSLYNPSVTRRRQTLLSNWHRIHRALGTEPDPAPSDRSLRGTTEPAVLRKLAKQLIDRNYAPEPRAVTRSAGRIAPENEQSGRVVVVGGAVMDVIFRTKSLPAPETSSEAFSFDLTPGGKGLTQAVAAAHLGLETYLIAAVADDRFGEEILEYLHAEGVNTSLVKRVPGVRTPFTGVIERELGDSIAVNWRNEGRIHLTPSDLVDRRAEIENCDALLTTFEVPRKTMQETLAIADGVQNRPLTIVTPGQPYINERISHDALSRMDYLVAHSWELGPFAQGQTPFNPDLVARNLLAFGIQTLCLLVSGGCTVYSDRAQDPIGVPTLPTIYKETSAARDAFCAALAAKLIENDGVFSNKVALWAAAAMSCAAANYSQSDWMLTRARIDALLDRSFGTSDVGFLAVPSTTDTASFVDRNDLRDIPQAAAKDQRVQ
ncbi:ribokinase [Kribbella sp. VKM Ac-2571]|uniref:PfkB family carbohydrate kinase n=1 Tax=Kribbella sp. VKM Ac-2571 TaxID=2512222 RepID=UPI00105C3BAC|nr:PfkB family carbohydrate kinase [Kribbella sp. VKM Ac-2571]TDO45482.1 ribokinase [Kribbella sp. VKM Ac-2571]